LFQKEAAERRTAQRAAERLRALQRATAALSAPLPFPAAARAVLREAVKLLGGSGGVVAVAGATPAQPELLARSGTVPRHGPWEHEKTTGVPEVLVGAWRSCEPVWPGDEPEGPAPAGEPGGAEADEAATGMCALPLCWEGNALGVLGIAVPGAD